MRRTRRTNRGAEVMSVALRWRLVLVVHGFEEAQASRIAFLRWLHERGELGGPLDGEADTLPASAAA